MAGSALQLLLAEHRPPQGGEVAEHEVERVVVELVAPARREADRRVQALAGGVDRERDPRQPVRAVPRGRALGDAEAGGADGVAGRHVREADELAARRRLLRPARPGEDLLDLPRPAAVPVVAGVGVDGEPPGLLEEQRPAGEEDAHADEGRDQRRDVGDPCRVSSVGVGPRRDGRQPVRARREALLESRASPVDAGVERSGRAISRGHRCLPALDGGCQGLRVADRCAGSARRVHGAREPRDAPLRRGSIRGQHVLVARVMRELPREAMVHLLLDRSEQRRRRGLGVVAGRRAVGCIRAVDGRRDARRNDGDDDSGGGDRPQQREPPDLVGDPGLRRYAWLVELSNGGIRPHSSQCCGKGAVRHHPDSGSRSRQGARRSFATNAAWVIGILAAKSSSTAAA